MHQEVVTFERSQAYAEYTLEDRCECKPWESQIEVPNIENTNNAM